MSKGKFFLVTVSIFSFLVFLALSLWIQKILDLSLLSSTLYLDLEGPAVDEDAGSCFLAPKMPRHQLSKHRASVVFLQYYQNKGMITRGKDRFFFR
jgi:hypothetical protein